VIDMIDAASSAQAPRSGRSLTPGELGMRIFLASLTMLFGAALVGFLVIRATTDAWSTDVSLPPFLWASAGLLIMLSLSMVQALRSIRSGRRATLGRWLLAVLLLGVLFVASQVLSLAWMVADGALPQTSMHSFAFAVLTTLHGLHVLGGLIATVVVSIRNAGGRYGAETHGGVDHLGAYWHYLGIVWLALWLVLAL
jgi:heme/copper-type cytochrome/quinol oxidase subunit 3